MAKNVAPRALLRVLAGAALASLLAVSGNAEAPRDAELVALHNGINRVHFGKGAIAGMVVLAHRENFNAHSFEFATFYLRTAATDSDPAQWQIIPFEIRAGTGRMENGLSVSGGADCQAHTFRLLRSRDGKAAFVVTADRAPGPSYADPRPVTFTWFKLSWNRDGGAGEPTAVFKAVGTEVTKKLYCDVDQALKAELHLGGAIMPREG